MTTSITAKSTKAVLLAHITKLEAQFVAQDLEMNTLRARLGDHIHAHLCQDGVIRTMPAVAQPAPAPRVNASRDMYYAYVARQRLVARTAGLRVATYKPFGDWSNSVSAS